MSSNGQSGGDKPPEIYKPQPPEWLPRTSSVADLGLQGYFPPHPSQEEEILTESNVKHGFVLKPAVPAEAYTTKGLLIRSLKEENLIPELETFLNDVYRRRTESLPQIPERSFKMPSRMTFNDARKQAWYSDLANPDVPLHKLGRNIPHGVRGHELLEMLQSINVSVQRAVWFIRVFGSNETAGLRNKPNYNPMQYSVDWALVVTGYIRKQLMEVALPSAPKLGLNVKHTFKGVLSDPESRERWVSRFSYTLELLKVFYVEFMVDQATFLSWLVQQLVTCNMAQASFLIRLAEDYHSDLVTRRALAKPFADGCLARLTEIDSNPCKDDLLPLRQRLVLLLQRTFLVIPSTFVSPRIWRTYSPTLRDVLMNPDLSPENNEPHARKIINQIISEMRRKFCDIQGRNEALLFQGNYPIKKGLLRQKVADVQLLNSITTTTDLTTVNFFESNTGEFTLKLHLLLSWSVCPVQYGCHRPYAAVTILRLWRDRAEERASRRDEDYPDDTIQGELFDWLDNNDLASDPRNLRSVSLLYGELVEKGLFSYDRYIQRLIARGENGLSFNEEPGSQHRMFLRTIPLHSADPALINQRKITLYGVRARSIPEDQVEKEIRQEFRNLLTEIFEGVSPNDSLVHLPKKLVLCTAARYEQIRVVKQWFLPLVSKHITRSAASSSLYRVYIVIVEIMEAMQCFRSLLHITLDFLKTITTDDLLETIIDTLRRHMDIWACMDVLGDVTVALYQANLVRKSSGVHVRSLVKAVLDFDDCRFLDDDARQGVIDQASHYAQALCPSSSLQEVVPPVLPEILLLAQDPNPDAPSTLARQLWFKYRTSPEWAWTVWDNVIASLRQLPALYPDPNACRACASRYALFLCHVDQHSANGIDVHAQAWFRISGMNELTVLDALMWDVVTVVFLQLAIFGAVKITTFLEGVVYPAWRLGAMIDDSTQYQSCSTYLHSANVLCRALLFNDENDIEADLPPTDLMEMQKLRSRRKDVYSDPHFRLLIGNLPSLVYFEYNGNIDLALRTTVNGLRTSICCCPEFRLGALRYFEIVLKVFSESRDPEQTHDMLHEPLVSTLRLIFNDANDEEERRSTSFLSPWKLSATAAVTSFVLQLIGKRLKNEATREQAEGELNRLVARLLHNEISCDEVDFIAEMARGVGESVAEKFLNRGLERIAEILDESQTPDVDRLLDSTIKAGYILKLLRTIMEPFRSPSFQYPSQGSTAVLSVDESVQSRLMPKVLRKLRLCEENLRRIHEKGVESILQQMELLTSCSTFLASVVQFDLGFSGAWTRVMKSVGDDLLDCMFRLALLYGGEAVLDVTVFCFFLDTAFYVFDEFPVESKLASTDLFQHCPKIEASEISFDMIDDLRHAALTLLRYETRHLPVDDLVYASKNSDGVVQSWSPVQMRPWEWIEHIGDPPEEGGVDNRTTPRESHTIRNNTSMPLEWFNVRLTGERVYNSRSKDEPAINYFEDDLVSESMYERDWREGRVGPEPDISERNSHSVEDEEKESGVPTRVDHERRVTPHLHTRRGASPALSSIRMGAGSRSSVASTSRRTQSPVVGTNSSKDAMDVDQSSMPAPAVPTKRKASIVDLTLDDDDSQVTTESGNDGRKGKEKTVAGKTVSGKTKAKKK